jgi:hypothetical protein
LDSHYFAVVVQLAQQKALGIYTRGEYFDSCISTHINVRKRFNAKHHCEQRHFNKHYVFY